MRRKLTRKHRSDIYFVLFFETCTVSFFSFEVWNNTAGAFNCKKKRRMKRRTRYTEQECKTTWIKKDEKKQEERSREKTEDLGKKKIAQEHRRRKENNTRTSQEPHKNLSNFTLNMNERSEEERRDKHRRILDTLSKEGGNVTMRCWIVFRVTLKRKDKIRGREKLPFAFCSHLFCISRLPSSFSFELFVLYPHSLSFLYSILIPCPPYKVFFVKTRSSHSGMKHPSSVIWSREERLSSCIFMCVLFP